MSAPGRAGQSLRARLAWDVLPPLVLTWAVGTGVLLALAGHFVGEAFDRALLDDAYALGSQVRAEDGRAVLPLSPRETRTLMFDQSELQDFAVMGPDGRIVAGNEALASAAAERAGFAELSFQGQTLRTVTVHRDQPLPFTVVVGQTTSSRTALLKRAVLYAVLPQAVLLLLLAFWLRGRIASDVHPLSQLEQAIRRRDADDLAPLSAEAHAASTTEVRRIGEAVDGLLARLKGSVSAQREFAGNVAHELRTPLAAIRAHAELGLAHADPAVWREHLQGVALAEQRASRMVDQLLALARAAEAGAALQRERLPLNELVRALVLGFLPRADAAGVDLGAEGLDETLAVETDRALVEGILSNLIDNALRYGKGSPPRITVRLGLEDGQAALSVRDNGPGLPSADAGAFAGRWVQGETGRRLGQGAGLGLSIATRYAALLGGTLTLTPVADGSGLCATLRLPLPAAQNAQ